MAQVIAVDEIGHEKDVQAIETILHSGCRVIATIHGSHIEEIMEKRMLLNVVTDKVFERFIILQGRKRVGHNRKILNQEYKCIYEEQT